jgi:endonuclease/exonuclease/phosphatase family metal-dependent hydrolase
VGAHQTFARKMKCLNWNLEWKTPATKAGRLIHALVAELDADTVCYTEVVRTMIPDGHSIESDPDYGYPNDGGRRKVTLWSKQSWAEVDMIGDDEMPSGRFVSGITAGVRFVGVCIPWRDAHVNTGRRDRACWEDHLAYCRGLERVLARYSADRTPTCVVGDFNQRIPRVGQPVNVAKALAEAIPADFMIATEGLKDAEGADLIDHFVVSPGLSIAITQIVPRISPGGTRLSDHVGVAVSLEKRRSEQVMDVNRP